MYERALYILISSLTFMRVISFLKGMEHLGALVLIIVRVMRRDLCTFLAVYLVFFFAVAQVH